MTIRQPIQLGKGWHKVWFYIRSFAVYYLPKSFRRAYGRRVLRSMTDTERQELQRRADYYAKSPRYEHPEALPVSVASFRYPYRQKRKFGTYVLDLYRSISCFPLSYRFAYLMGDVTETFDRPTIVKSRPIADVTNSVLLKLNSERHFQWVNDRLSFAEKKDMIVSRNIVHQPHRARLLEMFLDHPMCDFGMVNDNAFPEHPEWRKPYLTKEQQLQYKFIICIEGNDVATNLKWVMSSHSLAVMPKPKYETWFMEGTLIPNYHYVEIRPDYSDLIERVQYYIEHPEQAEAIICHANEYVRQFQNRRLEFATELLTMQNYFTQTNQYNCK